MTQRPFDIDMMIQLATGQDGKALESELASHGIRINRELKRLNILDAHGPRTAMDAISLLPGVKYVREQREFQLPPLTDDIPQ